jgi:pimeloyl-ACP methyl ester carboxylesterase
MIAAILTGTLGALSPAPCGLEGVPPNFEQQQGVQCGWVSVPLRHGEGNGRTIRLWTARIRGSGTRSEDPVLYINGGPGIATVDAILPYVEESKTISLLRQGRDVILFDQRGSGRSEENLCPSLAKSLTAIEAKGLASQQEDDAKRTEFAKCRAQIVAAGLDHNAYTTSATVADIEVLRGAFGVQRWNLAAISYGSLVALHAMRTTPGAIRSVILNSPYPPNSVTWAEQASSAAAAYKAIDNECSMQPACRKRFGELIPKLEATLARLEKTPLKDGDRHITGRLFAAALWPMAVRSTTVQFVPLAIDRAFNGDAALITKMVSMFAGRDSFGDFSPAQALAISCHETGRTTEWYKRARALYPALVSAAPDDSWDRLCATYRPGFAHPAFFAPVASTIPTLIYAGSLDPATPVYRRLPGYALLNRGDPGRSGGRSAWPYSGGRMHPRYSCRIPRRPFDTPRHWLYLQAPRRELRNQGAGRAAEAQTEIAAVLPMSATGCKWTGSWRAQSRIKLSSDGGAAQP